jgi:hypothetical protein
MRFFIGMVEWMLRLPTVNPRAFGARKSAECLQPLQALPAFSAQEDEQALAPWTVPAFRAACRFAPQRIALSSRLRRA